MTRKEKKPREKNENGNAIFLILIAIFLITALTFTFTNQNRGSTSIITDTQAEAAASQIIAYSSDIKQAIKRLTLRGCAETDISFENNIDAENYTNTNNPPDRCKIFHPDGGGLNWQIPPSNILDTAHSAQTYYQRYFMGQAQIDGAGTNVTDLALFLPHVTLQICNKLNEKVGNGFTTPPVEPDNWGILSFTGTFGTGVNLLDCTANACAGIKSVCFSESANVAFGSVTPSYIFYSLYIEN